MRPCSFDFKKLGEEFLHISKQLQVRIHCRQFPGTTYTTLRIKEPPYESRGTALIVFYERLLTVQTLREELVQQVAPELDLGLSSLLAFPQTMRWTPQYLGDSLVE